MAKRNDIVKAESQQLQPLENIENLIHVIRDKQVMLDRDLARLYGVETNRLNEQVKRNIERFPEDFMFQLTKEEFKCLRSQIATSNVKTIDLTSQIAISNKRGGQRYMPYAFTENGVAMLSGILRSPQAVSMNIQIMRTFNAMRHFIASNTQMFQRLEEIERNQLALNTHQVELSSNQKKISSHLAENDKKLEEVFRRLNEGEVTPKEAIFYEGQFFEARLLLEQIIKTATKRIVIIDGYVDAATFEMLDVRANGVTADIYSDGEYKTLRDTHNASKGKQPINTHKWSKPSHDRWVIIDNTIYHCGHSVKDLGKKLSAIMKMDLSPEIVLKEVR
ncbi:MAG: ORF6N domain-containing protein [Paludibacteraceae bacterium]|nr:ORF6N domain-containing protein [Paludibacteraceae bacterium]